MWKGATPTLAFKFPFKTSTISSLTFKCDQVGTNKISKVKSDFTASGDYILYLTLSQADTLGLVDGVALTMQFKCQFTNNTVTPSAFMIMPVHEVLDKVAFAGNPASGEPAFAIDVPFPANEGVVPVMFGMAVQSNGTISWNDITGKPSTFPPSAHTHDDRYYTETEVDTLLNAKQGALTAGQNITIQDNVISASGGGSGLPTATTAGTAAIFDGTNWIAQTGYGYSTTGQMTLADNVTLEIESSEYGDYTAFGQTPNMVNIQVGNVYKVIFNGTEYNCTASEADDGTLTIVYIGNLHLIDSGEESTGEPFVYVPSTPSQFQDLWVLSSEVQSTVTVTGVATVIHRLNETILPNGNIKNGRGLDSVVEGHSCIAVGWCSHAEGLESIAGGNCSHAEGNASCASGEYSHAEGYGCNANGENSHSEGDSNISEGKSSHSECHCTEASGDYSHAEGSWTTASGECSHAEGWGTESAGKYQHVSGKWNIVDNNDTYAVIVGNGSTTSNKSNAYTLDWNGNAVFSGNVTAGNILNKSNIAPDYSTSSTYSTGDYCIYSGQLYKCSTAITSAEAWNASHWTATTICAELKALFNQ